MSAVVPLLTVVSTRDPTEIERAARDLRGTCEGLRARTSDELVAVAQRWSDALLRARDLADVEGVSFLALWLRSRNVERLLDASLLGGRATLDRFVAHGGKLVKAQPHGLVCHWVAGNVPTLGIFSWALALLTKNVSLIRVSEHTIDATDRVLRVLAAALDPGDRDVVDAARFVHFDRADEAQHVAMSKQADCRIVWGSGEVVERIGAMPRPWHCHDVVFGPKYSIAVVDADTCGDDARLREVVTALARDVVAFDQQACSSPQTVFVEGDRATAERVMELVADALRRLSTTTPKTAIDAGTAAAVFRARARWGLGERTSFRASLAADWTVCVDDEPALKEAVQSRTVFLTAVRDLADVPRLLDARVQTVGCAIASDERALAFADAVTARGAARCVAPGVMNAYDLPWDGRPVLGDLVRWVSLKR